MKTLHGNAVVRTAKWCSLRAVGSRPVLAGPLLPDLESLIGACNRIGLLPPPKPRREHPAVIALAWCAVPVTGWAAFILVAGLIGW